MEEEKMEKKVMLIEEREGKGLERPVKVTGADVANGRLPTPSSSSLAYSSVRVHHRLYVQFDFSFCSTAILLHHKS
jgi:hypothetical protein